MSEPGMGHAAAPASVAESETGVLENELVVADIAAARLQRPGFRPLGCWRRRPTIATRFPEKLGTFAGVAQDSPATGATSRSTSWSTTDILLHMGHTVPASDRPGGARLQAAVSIQAPANGHGRLTAGNPGRAVISVVNRGNATWLHAEGRGWTRLGRPPVRGQRRCARACRLRLAAGRAGTRPRTGGSCVLDVELPAIVAGKLRSRTRRRPRRRDVVRQARVAYGRAQHTVE